MKLLTNNMLLRNQRNPKLLTINIIVFGIIGTLYYILFLSNKLDEPLFHPLYYGWAGIWISITGAISVYQYYKHKNISLYKNSIYSIFYSLIYFFGFFIISNSFNPEISSNIISIWIGLLLIAYFITFGVLNWYFGIYIAIFNITTIILALTAQATGEVTPVVWISLFNILGITNIYIQWSIVILSTFLGLIEKGFSMFDLFE